MDARQMLDNLADALVEDILAMSDEEIVAEALEDGIDIEAESAKVQAMIDKAVAERTR